MRIHILIVFSVVLANCSSKTEIVKVNPNQYDSTLAEKLGADQFGMKAYVMAFLKKGPNRSTDTIIAKNLLLAHLHNIQKLADEGKLIMAGPFLDDQDIRGIYIFNVSSLEDAKKLTEMDPAIQAGSLVMELHPWYGSAALVEITKIHKKLQKKSITEQ
mgnify:CR=1 FL=1